MKNIIELTYIKNVNCDLLVETTIDLNEIDLTKEELESKLKSFDKEAIYDIEEFLFNDLKSIYESESVSAIYEEYEIDDIEIKNESEIA